MPAYERLVGAWELDGEDATDAITWLMSLLTHAIDADVPPPTPRSSPGRVDQAEVVPSRGERTGPRGDDVIGGVLTVGHRRDRRWLSGHPSRDDRRDATAPPAAARRPRPPLRRRPAPAPPPLPPPRPPPHLAGRARGNGARGDVRVRRRRELPRGVGHRGRSTAERRAARRPGARRSSTRARRRSRRCSSDADLTMVNVETAITDARRAGGREELPLPLAGRDVRGVAGRRASTW